MPEMKILPNGGTVSVGYRPGSHERAKRGEVVGWTERASRGNRSFLWSVYTEQLTGEGYAITLTLRDCPESAEKWHALRTAFLKRMRRSGLIRGHWVTEWQRRGVPHLHGALYFPEGSNLRSPRYPAILGGFIIQSWIEVAASYGTGWDGQHVRQIESAPGWFQYVAKHASRSVKNYQRSSENIPQEWKKTGRMWGYVGEWPRVEEVTLEFDHPVFYRLRRFMLRWAIADARARSDWYRVRYLRNYLQSSPEVSKHRGIGDWLPDYLQLALHAAAAVDPSIPENSGRPAAASAERVTGSRLARVQ